MINKKTKKKTKTSTHTKIEMTTLNIIYPKRIYLSY